MLGVSFREDDSRTREGHAAANLGLWTTPAIFVQYQPVCLRNRTAGVRGTTDLRRA